MKMAFLRLLTIIALCCFLLVNSENTVDENQGSLPEIVSVLNYLNSNSNGIYGYKSGSLVSAQSKADIIEVTVDVNVNCLKIYPEIPCNEGVLVCHAFIGQNTDQTYQVLSDVKCSPKIKIIVDDMDEVKVASPMVFGEQSQGEMEKIDLSSEALPPSQGGADFVAVHRDHIPCLGCPFGLNTNVEGIEELLNTAVKHIESERSQRHKIVNVKRLQQQVVAGLKYILLAEVAQTICAKEADLSAPCILNTSMAPFICEVTFIEKPWINKSKHIIKNNCTVSQEFEPVDVSKRDQDMNNEILPHEDPILQDNPKTFSNYDAIAQTGNMEEEIDAARLADIESQILFGEMFETRKVSKVDQYPQNGIPHTIQQQSEFISADEPTPMITDVEDNLKVEPLNVEPMPLNRIPLFSSVPVIDESEPVITMYNYQNEEPVKTSGENIVSKDTDKVEPMEIDSYLPVEERLRRESKRDSDSDSDSDESSEKRQKKEKVTTRNSVVSNEIDTTTVKVVRKELVDTSEESSESNNSSKKKQRVKKETRNTSEKSLELSNSTEDKEEKLKRVRKAIDKNDSSSSSSSSSDDDDNHDKNKDNNNDNNERAAKLQKGKKGNDDDNDNRDDSSSSSSSSSSDEENNNRHKRSIGQMEKISSDEKMIVRDLADFAAATLDNIDDDNHRRVILQILGAKKLKLDGIYYQIILRLGISHCHENEHNENCREKLFTNLTKICKVQVHVEDDYSNPKVVKSQCQNIKKDENDRNRTNYSRYRRAMLVGGHTPMSTDDPDVKKFVGATLAQLDSASGEPNKHKAVKIVSATSQVVAGVRYVVIAKIGLSDCAKSESKLPETCGLLHDSEPEICTIDVWDRSWLNKTSYRINCNDKVFSFGKDDNSRRKRQLVGAPATVPKDSEEILNHLDRSLVYLDSKSEHGNKYIVDEVLSASQQVVAGTLTRIRASLALSDCIKGSASKNCTKLNNAISHPTICNFKIWEQPWINFTETNVTCDNNQKHSFRSKQAIDGWIHPQLLGADEELSTEHIEAKNFIKMALEYISSKSDTSGKYELKNIKKVSRRIVAGSLWNIEADIAFCKEINVLRYSYSMCPDQHIGCLFRVLNQPWKNNGLTINVTCDNDDQVYSYVPFNGFDEQSMLSSFDYEGAFKRFIKKYNKVYEESEYSHRLKVFRDNVNKIALLNKYEMGTAQYGFTQFADMTEKEFSKSHGYRPDLQNENELPFARATIPNIKLPKEFDWRTKGAVTAVKDQGLCGSCWAFSVTGNVEGQYAIKHGKLLEFSEQELVDCDKVDQGCNGGLMDNAYRVIEKLGGLETESDYPYEGDDEKCHFSPGKVRVELTGALNISHNETNMAKWLVQNGPISIAINANAMQFYVGGVSHPWKMLCNPNNLDHGVLIVGYGVHKYSLFNKTLPYWIVKNSWSTSWGEQGYYRVYRGDGTCGLNQTPSSAIVA